MQILDLRRSTLGSMNHAQDLVLIDLTLAVHVHCILTGTLESGDGF